MFDKTYYEEKKKKLQIRLQAENNSTLQKIFNLFVELQKNQQQIQEDINEANKLIEENKDKESAKVDSKPTKS
jgi:peptidoglycan hydrolase CwlO-like protein